MDNKKFMETSKELLFNRELPISIVSKQSHIDLSADSEVGIIMQTAIGQATTEVTPLHMALITSAIANGGNLMKPYLIDSVENYTGDQVKKYMPSSCGKLMTTEEAEILSEYMTETVLSGTASALQSSVYTAAGKTGTAEYSNDKSKSHAWFTGFSNVENPELVVCVVVEKSGAGSEYAVPVAKKIFDTYYQNK